jgi:hypothetical protein
MIDTAEGKLLLSLLRTIVDSKLGITNGSTPR